jgi:alpha-galactosidase
VPKSEKKLIERVSDINIDDCWSTGSRDASGKLVPDPKKWPNGIKAVADQIHNMGLKLGLYGDAGQKTCAGYPGSEGHEASDVDQLVSWGVDFWYVIAGYRVVSYDFRSLLSLDPGTKILVIRKFDNCYTPCNQNPRPQTCNSPAGSTKTWYVKFMLFIPFEAVLIQRHRLWSQSTDASR